MSLKSNGGNKLVTSKNYIGSIPRTLVPRNLETRFTCSAGELWPFYVEEVYPASNKKVKQGTFIRSITPLGPVMDNAFLDVFYFFVPFRLVWDHWEEFIAGYNKEAWAQDVEYTTPMIKFHVPDKEITDVNPYIGSWLDHVPGCCDVCSLVDVQNQLLTDVTDEILTAEEAERRLNVVYSVSALYPRAYVKIWNDWFRDENLQDELELYTGDNDEYAESFAFNLLSGSALPKAGKYHNRFTSALPRPVKGPDVLIPMSGLKVGVDLDSDFTMSNASALGFPGGVDLSAGFSQASAYSGSLSSLKPGVVANNVSNTIRMLRLATQTELLLSRDARGGTRYVESLLSHWSVHNGDGRLQRSEYLGSRQIPLNVTQVTNTSQNSDGVLGNVGAQSVTKDAGLMFNKAFTEHGVVIGLACIRTNISYGSGRRKQFTRKGRFDYIWPEFRHVGDVELKTTEIDQSLSSFSEGVDSLDAVFGFIPYGSELREGYNANTGLFRARASGSLSYLTYQEEFSPDELLTISSGYIEQSSEVVSRTLVDQSGPQYYGLIKMIETSIIPLDPTSDPGLMDHF